MSTYVDILNQNKNKIKLNQPSVINLQCSISML